MPVTPLNHGVNVIFQDTALRGTLSADSAFTAFFAAAPMNTSTPAKAGELLLVRSLREFKENFGWSEDFRSYGLCAAAKAFFDVYGVAEAAFATVLDAEKSAHTIPTETLAALRSVNGRARQFLLDSGYPVRNEITVRLTDGQGTAVGNALAAGIDYVLEADSSGFLLITPVIGGAILAGADAETVVSVAFEAANPGGITAADVTGAFDAAETIYPKLRKTPAILAAPGFSHIPVVGAALSAKCDGINGCFNCVCCVDIDSGADGALDADDAGAQKDRQGVNDEQQIYPAWGMLALPGTPPIFGSICVAGLCNVVDAENGAAPVRSISNTDSGFSQTVTMAGGEIDLTLREADALNAQGIWSAIYFSGLHRSWGNYSAIFPASTDPAKMWANIVRFKRWYGNSLLLTHFQSLDGPISRRQIDGILDVENDRLRMYAQQGWCAAGSNIQFLDEDNPDTELLNGHVRFRVFYAPFAPMQRIDFLPEFDVDAFAAAVREA
jgi:phage tail sheath protein FI